jgi:hypothetical protein
MGLPVEAEVAARRAYEEAKRLFLPQAMQEAGAILGVILLSLARVSDARRLHKELEQLEYRLVELLPARAFSSAFPHLLEMATGDWRAGADGLLAVADAMPPHYGLHAHLERAVLLARVGASMAEATEAARLAVGLAEEVGCIRCKREGYLRCCEVAARAGERDRAVQLLRKGAESPQPR